MNSILRSDDETAKKSAWPTRFVWLLGAVTATVGIQWTTYSNLAATWWGSAAYNHCALIPLISAYLIWDNRARLQALQPALSLTGLMFISANAVLWLAGAMIYINVFEHVAAVGFVIGVIWSLIGNQAAKAIIFPLAYLYFMVPEGDFLVPYLRDWTAQVVVFLLRLTDIPVYLEGRYLQIPSGHFHVAKACSGINYLLATLAVGSMFAYLNYNTLWRRVAFMTLAIIVPLMANGMRAYGIVMIAHLSDYRYALGVDHFIYGWVFFGIVIFALFAVGQTFAGGERRVPDRSAKAPRPLPSSQAIVAVSMAALALILAPQLIHARLAQTIPATDNFILPVVPGWSGPLAATFTLGGSYGGAARQLAANYTRADGPTILLEMAIYLKQEPGAELVTHANTVFDDDIWRPTSGNGTEQTDVAHTPVVQSEQVRGEKGERLIWWWFQLGDQATESAVVAKVLEASQKIRGRYAGAALVSLSVDRVGADLENSRAVLGEFVSALTEPKFIDRAGAYQASRE